jgi:hypothetical protein
MRAVHRTIVATILSALFVVAVAGTALAQQVYPAEPAVSCDTADVTAGSTFTCQASGFKPGSTVSVQATGETTGSGPWTFNTSAQANGDGVVTVTIQVPDDATGPASISFSGVNPSDELRVLSNAVAVNVTQPGAGSGTTTTGGAVAATGSDFTGGIIAVVALIGVGGLLLVVTRRRKHVKA